MTRTINKLDMGPVNLKSLPYYSVVFSKMIDFKGCYIYYWSAMSVHLKKYRSLQRIGIYPLLHITATLRYILRSWNPEISDSYSWYRMSMMISSTSNHSHLCIKVIGLYLMAVFWWVTAYPQIMWIILLSHQVRGIRVTDFDQINSLSSSSDLYLFIS